MQLNHDNYHSLENRYLTRSRVMDYLKCPRFFYQLHIEGSKKRKEKDVWNIGSAVDAWVTKSKAEFMSKFVLVARRNRKNPPKDYTELTQAQWDTAVEICEVLQDQPAIKDLASHNSQDIIHIDMPIGEHFVGLSAIPDWYIIDDTTCIITDLKTANKPHDKRSYHYTCMDLGYYKQFAIETIIFKKLYPHLTDFVYRHVGCDKDDDVKRPFIYYVNNECVEIEERKLIREIIPMIAAETAFLPKMITWDTAETVGDPETLIYA
jgi:hypothetical protein